MDRPRDYAPGAFFDEEAGHGGAEACRRAEALALSMSPRLNFTESRTFLSASL